jgi:hypothetical protein
VIVAPVPPPGEPPPHERAALEPFRGAGVTAVKSAAFESVSVQPFPARSSAVVFDSAGAAAEPS